MPLKYTTVDDLNTRLSGRLQIGGNVTTLGATLITPGIVLQYGEQIEAWIDAILQKRYQLPLKGTHHVLASIVEAGVSCELFTQYHVGQGPSEGTPADVGVCRTYHKQLKMLEAIALPGETLVDRTAETVGFQYASIQAGDRATPAQVVEW